MAENSSNGHRNGQPPAEPLMPRVAPPEGARSARNFDGSPVEIAAPETTVFDEAATARDADEFAQLDDADYRADFEENFRETLPATSNIETTPPLGIAINEEQTGIQGADWYGQASDATDVDSIEGEQLFAGSAETESGNGGNEPPHNGLIASGGGIRPDTPRDKEAGLFEHLVELRQRLIYGILGVALMMCVTWHYSLQLQDWFSAPILHVLNSNGIKKGILMVTGPADAFTIYFQFSLVSALILAMPWVLFQVWRFIEPAMTNSERRYTLVLVPFSSVLFFMGVALGYALSPLFFQFFLQFQPTNAAAQWNYQDSIMLMAKMLMIFGLAFQVPIIIIFFNKVGLLSRNLLIEYWRHAVVVIFIIVAILTPTWDPFTMTACALPPCLLYLLSIWLVKWL